MNKLNPQQKKFCDEYIKTGNAYQSAIKAGYSEKYADSRMHQKGGLMTLPKVKDYIDKQMKKLEKPTIATAEEVLEYLTGVLRGTIKEKVAKPIDGTIEIVEVDADLREKTKCAELLGKRYAIFTDKKEVDINMNKGLEDFFGDEE